MNNHYSAEVFKHWGNTETYREHERKTKNYTKEKWALVNECLMAIFAEFAESKNKGFVADSPEAQGSVDKLQEYITQNCYICTDDILASLGKMYAADERFKKNIDKYGEGTAEYVSDAIALCLSKTER